MKFKRNLIRKAPRKKKNNKRKKQVRAKKGDTVEIVSGNFYGEWGNVISSSPYRAVISTKEPVSHLADRHVRDSKTGTRKIVQVRVVKLKPRQRGVKHHELNLPVPMKSKPTRRKKQWDTLSRLQSRLEELRKWKKILENSTGSRRYRFSGSRYNKSGKEYRRFVKKHGWRFPGFSDSKNLRSSRQFLRVKTIDNMIEKIKLQIQKGEQGRK